uniref:non-specific serine/threonine protein kinase n=1 Tax=Pygocentrus nattereri TaxID=42514 RepID=A0AAR2KBK0_PYGNA
MMPSSQTEATSDQHGAPAPPVFLRKLRRAAVATGCDVRLRVTVGGRPQPTLHWYRNDDLLPSDDQDYGGLWIRDCHQADGGLYTCVAINAMGEARTSAVLAVLDLGEVAHIPTPCDGPIVEREMMALGSRAPGLQDPLQPGRQANAGCVESPPVRHLGVEALVRASQISVYYPAVGSEESMSLASDYYGSVFSLYRQRTFSIYSVQDGLPFHSFFIITLRFPQSPCSRSQLDSFTGEASPLVPSQPSENAQSPISPTHFISGADLTTAHNGNKKVEDELPGKIKSSTSSLSRGSQDPALLQTTKLPQSGSKIFDKVRAFEERRHSIDAPKVTSSGRPRAGFRQNISSGPEDVNKAFKVCDNPVSDVALKRSIFKQRASSLEEQPSYARKVQNFQSKFSEELQRIKKLVGRPNIRKAFSTEHLAQTNRQPMGKVELFDRLNDADEKKSNNAEVSQDDLPKLPAKELLQQTKAELFYEAPKCEGILKIKPQVEPTDVPESQLKKDLQPNRLVESMGTFEKVPVQKVSEQCSPRITRKTLGSRLPSPMKEVPSPEAEQPLPKKDRKSTSPVAKRAQSSLQEEATRAPPKPPRLLGSDSSDDSYMSTEEDPEGLPAFELPLKDAMVAPGSEVMLECVITGNPYQVTWRKGDVQLKDGAGYEVIAERGRHALHIRQMRPSDAGTYSVIATGKLGRVSSRATLFIQSGERSVRNGQHELHEVDNGKYKLRIKSAEKSDAGVYVCKIINEYGTKQTECRLEVKAPPPPEVLAITSPVQDVRVRAGKTALFECHVTGPQDIDVDWLTSGKLIQPALLDCKMQFDGKRCRLLLRSVHEDDSGCYTCKLSTAKEELITSAKLTVIPSKEPLFTRKLEALEVIEGRSARFDCKVSGTPPPEVTWMHCEHPVVESENIHIFTEGGRHSLVISHVTKQSEGFYSAIARNAHGQVETSSELYVQEPRSCPSLSRLEKMPSIPEEPEVLEGEMERRTMPDFVKPLSDLEVVQGKEAVLKCKVTGMPYPTIAWYHNSQKIESTEDRKMTQSGDVHSLVIRSVCHGHSGVYKSVISNKVGKATCYAHLYVTDIIPEPPDGPPVVESITGRTITLSWKSPKNLDPSIDPSSLMYAVQQQALGSIQWIIIASSLRETSYTMTSLSKGVRYAFRVLCSTGKAFSKPSQPTDLVQLVDKGQYLRKAPVILDKPDIVYAVENQPVVIAVTLNHVQATVTWKRRGMVLVNKPGTYEVLMPDDDQHALKISRVKGTDIGQLICMVNNQYGSDLCTIQLVMAAPPAFETIMEDLDVCVGETPRFAVVVDGEPDPDILWYKDNVLLAESSHFTFVYDDQECSLVVLNAQPEDSGVYTCTAKNLAGEISCKAELTVHTEDEGTILRRMRRLTDYYDIHKEIGRGAFSYVKRVTSKKEKIEYAAKFISARAKRKASALREMELLAELDHERILYFHDAFEKKNVVVIITELCHEELLERLTKKTTVLESEIRSCIRQIIEGISYLHQNDIIHLDLRPENILLSDRKSDQIRICDFGNALKLTSNEAQYCKYGTPEFIAPEIVNQTPVSKATDIWPVGVITYLCLTGVSPFAGENDHDTLLNIRNSNVAFEESMFADLCREAKGFVIKLLVTDRLRPDATECLRHPWFKTPVKGKSVSTTVHKQVLARRKWQRSLISYKSKMVMRSIPELLDDSSCSVSLAVPRNLKEGSPPPSSSSDSDEDIDELPFIPMPLTMMFSGSRMSLTEIHEDDEVAGTTTESSERTEQPELPVGLSLEAEQASAKPRRRLMRRGSSADSALLLHITPEEGATEEASEESEKNIKKAVSMELPHRSNSPCLGKLNQEDYALKLELMRQKLLRGGSMDKKLSGLRGPLFETLGVDDERRTASLDQSPPKTKVFRKSASFTHGESEPMPLHRRSGAPLEIPSAQCEEIKLQEAKSVSGLTEQPNLEPQSVHPREISSKPLTPDLKTKEITEEEERNSTEQNEPSLQPLVQNSMEKTREHVSPSDLQLQDSSESLPHDIAVRNSRTMQTNGKYKPSPLLKISEPETSSSFEHPAVFAKVALSSPAQHPSLRSDIKDIDSEEVFEARFKKRESSLTRGLKRLTRTKTEEKSPVLSQKSGEEVYRPGPTGAPLEFVSRGLQEKAKSLQDLREVDRDPGLGVIGRLSLRAKKTHKDPERENVERGRKKLSENRSHSEETHGEEDTKKEGNRTPLLGRLRYSKSEGVNLKKMDIPENQLASQTACAVSKESLDSTSSAQSVKSSQNFPPVFHIKLKDHILLEGDPVTLSCLPAGSPQPKIVWMKDKKPLEIEDRMNLMSSPDGRQLLMIMKTGKKDAGLYECVATNNLASATSSCTLSLASIPKRPGTPEIPQTYNNTALVLWKPADNKAPCTYTLERKTESDYNWLTVAAGIADCYYNVTDLPSGVNFHFRVACVNKAGQGPYSNVSERVGINIPASPSSTSEPSTPQPVVSSLSAANVIPIITEPKVQTDVVNTAHTVAVNQLPLKVKSVPPFVPPKPNSPVNVVPPITQVQSVSQRPCTAPPSVGRPISPVPTYVPATTARVAPTPITPPVVIASSISPIGDGAVSTSTETPMGRAIPAAKSDRTLRQGVPQKPYTFLDERARGRFGIIRDCRENATGRMFMAKIVCYDQENKQTVLQEYEILKSLHNEGIMALHEAYVTPRYLVLITECCMGKEILYSLTDRFRYSEDDVVGYIVQILHGLEYLHNHRILHLDIKPDNVMVTNLSVIKIIDFGSAQNFNPLFLKHYSRDLGTLEYMAPEMLKGDVVGPAADIWSLGVLTYVMLSGRLPFQEKDPRQTETKIHTAKFDSTKLYPNVSQSALAFLKKLLNGYQWSRPTTKDCFSNAWLQDSYLMKLRRQTLTFTTTQLKEFLGDHQRQRAESATKHKVLLRAYQSGPQSPASTSAPSLSSTPGSK